MTVTLNQKAPDTMSVKTVQADTLPPDTLQRQLVTSGGKGYLVAEKNIPADDDLFVVVSTELQPWGDEFGGFKAFLQGPIIQVLFTEEQVFQNGERNTSFSIDLKPVDLPFMNNSWMTPWRDGQVEVERGYVSVLPAEKRQFLEKNESRRWCYRAVVTAKTNLQVEVVVQVLPLDIGTISSGVWADSTFIGGITVHRQRAEWFPTLPPSCSHQGPAPFLVDRRGGRLC